MGDVVTLPAKPQGVLVCDDCGHGSHAVHYRKDDGVFLIVAIECANCGKTIDFERDGEVA